MKNLNITYKKKVYTQPNIDCIKFDSDISLCLQSQSAAPGYEDPW